MNSDKKRFVRSFVRREGRITAGQKAALENYWSRFGLDTAAGILDFKGIFGRDSDVILEIGFGSGASLLDMAVANPQFDYIGADVYRPGVGALLSQVAKKQITNLRVFQEDAVEILQKSIADASLSRVQIYFPDPWHKKRHHKRRLIQPHFAEQVGQKIKRGGCVHLATDWQDYAEHMMEVFSQNSSFRNLAGEGCYLKDPTSYRVSTKFEARGRRLGHQVWDLVFIRVA